MINDQVEKLNLPQYKKEIIKEKYYDYRIKDIDDITNLSKAEKSEIKDSLNFRIVKPYKKIDQENFSKVLFKTEDENLFESVLIKEDDHHTVCLSTQIGCPVKCIFCASGSIQYKRNLSTREIIEQYLYWRNFLDGENPNIVFMGMGEPLLNLENVMTSIKIFIDPNRIGLSARKITISTVGIIEPLKKLLSQKNQFKLAISLHSPFQSEREKLIPVAKNNHIDFLFSIINEYAVKQNKRISFEYLLLDKLNDSEKHAEELIKKLSLLPKKLVFLNLIKFNKVDNSSLTSSSNNTIFKFADKVRKNGINTFVRFSKGENENSACGQLAQKISSIK